MALMVDTKIYLSLRLSADSTVITSDRAVMEWEGGDSMQDLVLGFRKTLHIFKEILFLFICTVDIISFYI